MDDPPSEISSIITSLTSTKPSVQQATLEKYFTPGASFTHPFCRTGSSPSSLWLISRIYLWYKIMSPRIAAKIHSVTYNPQTLTLYVHLSQVFCIWVVPTHRSDVELVTVLQLTRMKDEKGKEKYYITSQNDLYQTDQWIRFVLPWFAFVVPLWQFVATLFCVIGSYVLAPVTWWGENYQEVFARPLRGPGS